MSRESFGRLIGWIGGIVAVIALFKVAVVGYYPSEVPLYGALLIGGAILVWVGNRIFTRARSERD